MIYPVRGGDGSTRGDPPSTEKFRRGVGENFSAFSAAGEGLCLFRNPEHFGDRGASFGQPLKLIGSGGYFWGILMGWCSRSPLVPVGA